MGDQSVKKSIQENIILRLFISGETSRSTRAIKNLKEFCKEHFDGKKYEIEIIDIRKNPDLAREEQIIATPTLISKLPPSIRQIIGDLSDKEKVLRGLEVISSAEIVP